MKKSRGIRKGHIAFLLVAIAVVSLTIMLIPQQADNVEEITPPMYEPAHPDAPRLANLGIIGGQLDYSPEVRYYEIDVPDGNPILPEVWATSPSDEVSIEIYQAFFTEGKSYASARITLVDEEYTNSYEVRFVKNRKLGVVLQYDDKYTYVPDYKLKKGQEFVFLYDSDDGNIEIDSNGVIYAKGVSDKPSLISVYVGNKHVESLTVNKTVKAEMDLFIVAGQGNAYGEGGSIEESVKPLPGTAYTVEIDDRTFAMNEMGGGRAGFTPALAEKWYNLTGKKSLFLQSAISDVSVTEWVPGGEAYELALTRFKYHLNKLNGVNSNYTVKNIYCVWFHGEWDVAHGMSAEDYAAYFEQFYKGFKEETDFELMTVVPARETAETDDDFGIVGNVCSAQFYVSNAYDDIRILTKVPFEASVSNGMVCDDRLYYSQQGYNAIGAEIAENLYDVYGSDLGKDVKELVVFGDSFNERYENGGTVKLTQGESARAVVSVLPYYSINNVVEVTYDESLIQYTVGGMIEVIGELIEKTEIVFSCGEVSFSLFVESAEEPVYVIDGTVEYAWEFDGLGEVGGLNDLTVSSRSDSNKLKFENGMLVSNERMADLVMAVPVQLKSDADWSIEWSGMINDNGILMGNEFSTKGYIYLAPFAQNMGYSVRMVDNDGKIFYLPYGQSAEQNRAVNLWRIAYKKDTGVITLYLNGSEVSSTKAEEGFSFEFTNLLGRYGSEALNYCYVGKLDSLKIAVSTYKLQESAEQPEAVEE